MCDKGVVIGHKYGDRHAEACSNVIRCIEVGVFLHALSLKAVYVWPMCQYGIDLLTGP